MRTERTGTTKKTKIKTIKARRTNQKINGPTHQKNKQKPAHQKEKRKPAHQKEKQKHIQFENQKDKQKKSRQTHPKDNKTAVYTEKKNAEKRNTEKKDTEYKDTRKICRQGSVLMAASVASMIDQFNMPNIRLMQEMGYRVHVSCNFREGNTCSGRRTEELKRKLREMGVVCHQWDCPRSVWPVGKCVRAYRQLLRLVNTYHFKWMHCHSPIGGVLARIAAHSAGIPVLYTAHGFHFYKGAPLKNWLLFYPAEKLLSYVTDVLVTVNQEDYRFAKRFLHAGRTFRIPGVGIDTGRFFKEPADRRKFCGRFRIPENAFVLLSVGELNKGKNHKMVIRALAALEQKDVYYLICGKGALRDELYKYAVRFGVQNRIRMPGFLDRMPHIYQNADIFVFPSVREGMPAALMEAMAAGLPCVVSDIRGCRELIDNAKTVRNKTGGFRFSLEHPKQLVKALDLLIRYQTLRQAYGTYNQKKIRNYDQKLVRKKMRRIYAVMKLKSQKCGERNETKGKYRSKHRIKYRIKYLKKQEE